MLLSTDIVSWARNVRIVPIATFWAPKNDAFIDTDNQFIDRRGCADWMTAQLKGRAPVSLEGHALVATGACGPNARNGVVQFQQCDCGKDAL